MIEIAEARIPQFNLDLEVDGSFKPITLEEGDKPHKVHFELVPKGDKKSRVEAAVGAWLNVEFRPSRGSERWARPTLHVQLGSRPSG